jgi:hypothetical protein
MTAATAQRSDAPVAQLLPAEQRYEAELAFLAAHDAAPSSPSCAAATASS